MIFDDIAENERLKERLAEAARTGRLSHAYIFEGDLRSGKEELVKCFTKAILCEEERGRGCERCLSCVKLEHGNYEDLLYVRADGMSVKDEAIEKMQEFLRNKPFYGERNIAVIADADTMTLRAQNRLLKTLEEPPEGAIIILLSENPENLLKTVRSRCVIYRVSGRSAEPNHEIEALATELPELLLKRSPFYLLNERLKPVTADRDKALALLDALEREYGRIALDKTAESRRYPREYIFNAVSEIEEAKNDLRRNIGTGYVLKCLALKIGGK